MGCFQRADYTLIPKWISARGKGMESREKREEGREENSEK